MARRRDRKRREARRERQEHEREAELAVRAEARGAPPTGPPRAHFRAWVRRGDAARIDFRFEDHGVVYDPERPVESAREQLLGRAVSKLHGSKENEA